MLIKISYPGLKLNLMQNSQVGRTTKVIKVIKIHNPCHQKQTGTLHLQSTREFSLMYSTNFLLEG